MILDPQANNSLILATTPLWTAHHAESIELAHCMKDYGKNLYVCCTGVLRSCPANPNNLRSLCKACRRETRYTKKKLLPKNFEFIELELTRENMGYNSIFKNTRELLAIYHEEMPIGRLVASQLFDDLKGEYIDVVQHSEKILRLLSDGVALYEKIKDLILRYNISEVYAWNGRRQSDGPALWAAKALNKRYVAYIAGGQKDRIFTLDGLSVQDFEARTKDMGLLVASNKDFYSEDLKNEAEIYFKEYIAGNLNQTGYVFNDQVNSQRAKINKSKKPLLLVVTSSPKEHVHQPTYDKYFGDDPYGRTLAFLGSDLVFDKYDVIVRWHPFNAHSNELTKLKISRLIQKYGRAEHFPPESKVDTYDILANADVVYGTGSTVAQHAAFCEKVVLIYGPSAIMFGQAVIPIDSPEEAIQVLNNLEYFDAKRNGRNPADIFKLACYARYFGRKFEHIDCDEWRLRNSNLLIQKRDAIHVIGRKLKKLLKVIG